VAADCKPTPRCIHSVYFPDAKKGATTGNRNCGLCMPRAARAAPGTLRIEDNRTSREKREYPDAILLDFPAR